MIMWDNCSILYGRNYIIGDMQEHKRQTLTGNRVYMGKRRKETKFNKGQINLFQMFACRKRIRYLDFIVEKK